jgi:hypothetical protein
MIRLGFHRLWVDMIMRLVTSVSFSVLLNGDRLESFVPSRGIRQGDPISPYLFLLVAEGLSCLLKSRVQSSNLNGITVATSALMVSHLLFADDSLLFFKANRESADEVKDVLHIYCQAFGQQINMDKSSIHFAKGVSGSTREEIMDILEVHNEALSEKYLGMPTNVGTATVTATFLAPNKSPNKSCVFSKLSSRAQLPPSNPSHCPSLSPWRACRESRRHRLHPGQHPRVPSQRRGRPPCRESRACRGPAGRSASPSPPSRKSRRRPKIEKPSKNLSPIFLTIFPIF